MSKKIKTVYPEGGEKAMNLMEVFREEGRLEGMERGRLEGMEKGMERGRLEGMEKGMERGRLEGMEKGMEKGKLEIARNALKKGMDFTLVQDLTGLSKAEIEKLARETINTSKGG